jgi:hypothetical protein
LEDGVSRTSGLLLGVVAAIGCSGAGRVVTDGGAALDAAAPPVADLAAAAPPTGICLQGAGSGTVQDQLGQLRSAFVAPALLPSNAPPTVGDAGAVVLLRDPGTCRPDCSLSAGDGSSIAWISAALPRPLVAGAARSLGAGDLAAGSIVGGAFHATALDGSSSGTLTIDALDGDGTLHGHLDYDVVTLGLTLAGTARFDAPPCHLGQPVPPDLGAPPPDLTMPPSLVGDWLQCVDATCAAQQSWGTRFDATTATLLEQNPDGTLCTKGSDTKPYSWLDASTISATLDDPALSDAPRTWSVTFSQHLGADVVELVDQSGGRSPLWLERSAASYLGNCF